MNKNRDIAIELAKILIQNSNVVPVGTICNKESDYIIGDAKFTFFEIVSHYITCINRVEEYF